MENNGDEKMVLDEARQKELSEIGRELAELDERERALAAREKELEERQAALEAEKKPARMRDNLYERIPLSVGTMNKIIIGLSVLLVVVIVVGIVWARL